LVRYPPLVKPGTKFDPMVLSIDLAPTLLEAASVAAPQRMHGRSLVPLLKGEAWQPRTSFLIEHSSDTVFRRMHNLGYQAVRTERWKYIRYRELEGADELYDLAADPYELKNLAGDPSHAGQRAELRTELQRLLAQTP
jgi:N-acetylglucosamine-6-sulfatase